MIYEMKLNEDPFERIKNGTKTIEFRLYEEKRNLEEEKELNKEFRK